MMIRILAVLAVLVVGLSRPDATTAQTYTCADTVSNDDAAATLDYLSDVVTGSDSVAVSRRDLYQLPKVALSKVDLVLTTRTCRTAAQHFYAAFNITPPANASEQVLVVKVSNNRYVVSVLSYRMGEFGVTLTFDTKWHLLANVVG